MANPCLFAPTLSQHHLVLKNLGQKSYIWTVSPISPFDELLISWNAERPLKGHYVILASVYIDQWSPWLLYASWGSHCQYSFHDILPNLPVHTFQDQIELLEGRIGTKYRIRVESCEGAMLTNFYTLYACTSRIKSLKSPSLPFLKPSLSLPVPGLSQLSLPHPRAASLCSPTATSAIIRYLCTSSPLNPLNFAQQVYDAGFDIYGNWSFNVAQAFVELGRKWQCWYARATGFEEIWNYLHRGLPVVISIKGNLTRGTLPYKNGHLIVIKGYDAQTNQILCMDPAFPSDDQTHVCYFWEELMEAWENRHYLTYFFSPK